jgi:hypothetical protein
MTPEELAEIEAHLVGASATGQALMPSGLVHIWYYQDVPRLIAEVKRLQESLKWHKGVLQIYNEHEAQDDT